MPHPASLARIVPHIRVRGASVLQRRGLSVALLTLALLSGTAAPAQAQGLIWSIPEDGTGVLYVGTYKHTEERPNSAAGALELNWERRIWVKSVGTEQAEYKGQMVDCRWIEIKVVTGKIEDGIIEPGLVGARLYKVLVPESEIRGQLLDDDQLPVALIPIVRGVRRFGETDIKPISTGVLQVYPLITFIPHLPAMDKSDGTVDPNIAKLGPLEATQLTGESIIESPTTRMTTNVTLFRTDQVPFGLAKWSVNVTRESKDINDARSDFQLASTIQVEMTADEILAEAESEIATE